MPDASLNTAADISAINTVRTQPDVPAHGRIGWLFQAQGKLGPTDEERVVALAKQKGLLFGEAAMALGLVTPDDLQQALALQFGYPCLRRGQDNLSQDLITAFMPFTRQSERLRAVRSFLLLRWFKSKTKTLAVLSPDREDGRSYIAANLAVVFAQAGSKTLLVDADMRRPRQHQLFNCNNNRGLSTVLAGRSGQESIKPVKRLANLSLLCAGPVPPNPQELLSGSFTMLLDELCRRYDHVLLDTPAEKSSADARIVAAQAKGVLVVARRHKSRVPDLAYLRKNCQAEGVRIVGGLINAY